MSGATRTEAGPSAGVLLLAGSPGDLDSVLQAEETLQELGIPSRLRVVSAHRTPEAAVECARNAEAEGFEVIIAFAGLAMVFLGL